MAKTGSKRLLIVEDDRSITELLKINFARECFTVTSTGNGEEALNLIQELKPDLHIIDLMIEETSGLETGGATRGLLHRSPWKDPEQLPRFATSRGVRMLLGNDFTSSALGFRLDHEPGGFYNQSPATTQLLTR